MKQNKITNYFNTFQSKSLFIELEKTFNKDGKNLRTIFIKEEVWMCAKDICEYLNYKDTDQTIRKNVDDEDKKELNRLLDMNTNKQRRFKDGSLNGVIFQYGSVKPKPKGRINQDTQIYINEKGFYSLILKSRKKEAKEFNDWISKEVLPSIRKTGKYELIMSKKKCEYCGHEDINENMAQKDGQAINRCMECDFDLLLMKKLQDYKNGAKNREIQWELTDEEATWFFLTTNCWYCNQPNKDKNGNIRKWMGIDRIDSNQSYNFMNCLACCSYCNILKNDLNFESFILQIDLISKHLNQKINN